MTHSEYVKSLRNQFLEKNKSYGSAGFDTYRKYGIVSYVVRLSDKINRLHSLDRERTSEFLNESRADTYGDIATYCAMAMASIATWTHDEWANTVSGILDKLEDESECARLNGETNFSMYGDEDDVFAAIMAASPAVKVDILMHQTAIFIMLGANEVNKPSETLSFGDVD